MWTREWEHAGLDRNVDVIQNPFVSLSVLCMNHTSDSILHYQKNRVTGDSWRGPTWVECKSVGLCQRYVGFVLVYEMAVSSAFF